MAREIQLAWKETKAHSLEKEGGVNIAPIATRTRARSKAAKPTDQPPVIAVKIEEQDQTKVGTGDVPTPPPHPSSLLHNTDIVPSQVVPTKSNASDFSFHPTAFLVRAINSTSGAAIHASQLAPHGPATSIADMSLDAFLQKVAEQIGFDVKGRVHAVMPKELASAFVTKDVMIKLGGEEPWVAVLQIWQNAESKTGEFVVE